MKREDASLLRFTRHPNDNSEYLNAGAEYSFRGLFSLRAGYRNLFEKDGEQGLTVFLERLRLGASMSNFGPKMRLDGRDILFSEDPNPNNQGNVEIVNAQFRTDQHPLPLLFRVGLAWDAYHTTDHRLMISTDAAHPNDNSEYLNMGAEYSFRDLISLRAGYRNLFEEDGEQGLTFGAGLDLRLDRSLRTRLDYAYADFGRLTQTHWFTMNLVF